MTGPSDFQTNPILGHATALALRGYWDELEEFLDAEPDSTNATNSLDNTLLHIVACMDGGAAAIRQLIALNADVNKADKSGATPLGNAIHSGHRHGLDTDENIAILVAAGANLSQFDETGNPPLHAAIYARRPKVIKLLLDAGANPLQLNSYGDDAYAWVDYLGDKEMSRLLSLKTGTTGKTGKIAR